MSKILLVSSDPSISSQLLQIFQHYFPHPESHPSKICINTKYYITYPQIHLKDWSIVQQSELDSVDCLVMVAQNADNSQKLTSSMVDQLITKTQPSSFIMVTHSKFSDNQQSPIRQQMCSCENFVQVIFDNLQQIVENKPQYKSSGLLVQDQDSNQIFSLFSLLQTTPWTQIQKKESKQSKAITEQVTKTEQSILKNPEKQSKQQENKKQASQSDQQQMNEQDLEKQMLQFESLLSQITELKVGSFNDRDRKKKAENIINMLSKNMML